MARWRSTTTTRHGTWRCSATTRSSWSARGDPALSHTERLPAVFAEVLAEAGLTASDVDLLAVATGPGTFTGLRIALAAVQGLALALNRPAAPSRRWRRWRGRHSSRMPISPPPAPGSTRRAAKSSPPPTAGPPAAPRPGRSSRSPRPLRRLPRHRRRLARRRSPGTPVVAACHDGALATLEQAGHLVWPAPRRLAGTVGRIAWRMHAPGLLGPAACPDAGLRAPARCRGSNATAGGAGPLAADDFQPAHARRRPRRHPGPRRGVFPPALDPRRLRARAGRSGALLPLRGPHRRGPPRRLLLVLADLRRNPCQQLRGPSRLCAAVGSGRRHCSPSSSTRPRRLGAPKAPRSRSASSNVPAIALYEAGGFGVAGLRRAYYTHPVEDALILCAAAWHRIALNRPGAVLESPPGTAHGAPGSGKGADVMTDYRGNAPPAARPQRRIPSTLRTSPLARRPLEVLGPKPHLTDDEQLEEVTLEEGKAAAEGPDGSARAAPP